MPKLSAVQGWSEESNKELEQLREKVKEFNAASKVNEKNEKELQTVMKKFKSNGDPYFLVQKRKQFVPTNKFINDDKIINEIKDLQSKNYSKLRIAKELDISLYKVNKILKSNIV